MAETFKKNVINDYMSFIADFIKVSYVMFVCTHFLDLFVEVCVYCVCLLVHPESLNKDDDVVDDEIHSVFLIYNVTSNYS